MTRAALVLPLLLAVGCGSEGPCPAATLPPLSDLPAYAVVTSDYVSSAIALLDADGRLVDEAWVDSGSREAGIAAALSGDVSLPSAPLRPDELTVIDRFGVDLVDRFDLSRGIVVAQLATQLDPSAGGSGFRANPQDAILDGDALLVSRFAPNLDPEAPELDRGNDLVRIDAFGPVERIGLEALDVEVEGRRIYARPGRIARLGEVLIVGLGRLDADFRVGGDGAVAVIEGDPPAVSALPLPGLVNCPDVRANPAGDAVIVVCAGETFGTPTLRRQRAGVVRIVSTSVGVEITDAFLAVDHPESPVPGGAPIPLGEGRVALVAPGDTANGDALLLVDLTTGATSVEHRSERAFVLGAGSFNPESALLLVPDAEVGVMVFRFAGDGFVPVRTTDASPCRGLGAREVGALLR